ncbi:MAG: Gfo/Idh/MocA family oxidoreductase [Oscillospiraceae bacterium]|nr:Gfo/Idh/MocA family oxidoreductase [Oscillospiraceae bacterium]
MTFNVGIIGCGAIFPQHAISVRDIANCALRAVCDIDKSRAEVNAGYFSCNSYTDYKEMIAQEKLNVLHICLPHHLHAEVAIYAMERGIHVLCEKPMSITVAEARQMIDAAKRNNVHLAVIFQNRYNAGSLMVKEALDGGKLGKILSAKASLTWHKNLDYYRESNWRGKWSEAGGGVIINQAIHTLDLVRWFVDSEVATVEANISNRVLREIEVEDSAEGLIRFENGVFAVFQAVSYYGYDAPTEIELYCENGIAKLINDKGIVTFNDGEKMIADRDPNDEFVYVDGYRDYWGVSHVRQIGAFYDALEKGETPEITPEDALKTQDLICKIYENR